MVKNITNIIPIKDAIKEGEIIGKTLVFCGGSKGNYLEQGKIENFYSGIIQTSEGFVYLSLSQDFYFVK